MHMWSWLILANIQELPPPYHVGQPISIPSDVKKDYPQQAAGYPDPTGPVPMQNLPQQDYLAHIAYNPRGYSLQPYFQVSSLIILYPIANIEQWYIDSYICFKMYTTSYYVMYDDYTHAAVTTINCRGSLLCDLIQA